MFQKLLFFPSSRYSRTIISFLFTMILIMNGVTQISREIAPKALEFYNSSIPPQSATEETKGGSHLLETQWDIQFNYLLEDSAKVGGLTGIVQIGAEFWVSKWSGNTIYRLTKNASLIDTLVIPDGNGGFISGTRGMTTDGTFVYMGNATKTIYKVDPQSFILVDSIISQGQTARYITYDSTANSGEGGFWIGNFDTDIDLISRDGVVLQTIPLATHGISGTYGAVVDNFSESGPYLWLFSQNQTPSNAVIIQLKLPSGIPTDIIRNVDADLGTGGDLAGGIFISDQIVNNKVTIGGILQSSKNVLFGYELDFEPVQTDVKLLHIWHDPSLSQIPSRFQIPLLFGGSVKNNGVQSILELDMNLSVYYDSVLIHSDKVSKIGLPNLEFYNFSFDPYIPTSQGNYVVSVDANTRLQVDEKQANNIRELAFSVTDTVLARDDGIMDGSNGYGISRNSEGLAVSIYEFPIDVYLQGVEIEIATPINGSKTQAIIVQIENDSPIGSPILYSTPITIQKDQSKYYLPFTDGFAIEKGQIWGIGITEEENTTMNLAQSSNYYTPNINFFSIDNGITWSVSNLTTSRFIRPIIASCKDFSLSFSKIDFNSAINLKGEAEVKVNNSRGAVNIQWNNSTNSKASKITDLMPGTYTVIAQDANSCFAIDSVIIENQISLEEELEVGIKAFDVFPNPFGGIITINIELIDEGELNISVIDLTGRKVFQKNYAKISQYYKEIDFSSLSKGVYIINLNTAKGRISKRLLKNK